jgi:uncharacterized lipoprotein YmbA
MALLIGCTSKPLSVRYYLLHTPDLLHASENADLSTGDVVKTIVVLKLLTVADYLRQASLVMQVDKHQLYYSRQDVWAEKLHSSFYKALLQDLNADGQKNYVASSSPNAASASAAITIKLEHFHATDRSTVVSSGRYWLSENEMAKDKHSEHASTSHSFFFESDLTQDGYAHAVKQLRGLVNNLAKQIEKDIAALPNN